MAELLRSTPYHECRADNFLTVASACVCSALMRSSVARFELDRSKGERRVGQPKAKGKKRRARWIAIVRHPRLPGPISIVIERELPTSRGKDIVSRPAGAASPNRRSANRVPRLNSRMPGHQERVCLFENSTQLQWPSAEQDNDDRFASFGHCLEQMLLAIRQAKLRARGVFPRRGTRLAECQNANVRRRSRSVEWT